MTGAWLTAMVLAWGGPAGLPLGTARWRMELDGVPVGVVELSIRCEGPACEASWDSRQRLPEETGGAERARRVVVPVDRDGRATGPAVLFEDGARREAPVKVGALPALLAAVVLGTAAAPGREACAEVAEEATGATDRACARVEGDRVVLVSRAVRERLRMAPSGFPSEVLVEGQGARFVLDAAASLPSTAPRLYGSAVPGPDDPRDAARFCGARPDPAAPEAVGVPAPFGEGSNCQAKTADWLRRARTQGWRGRTAVGVAYDGGAFVWHAWAEVRQGGRWVPVDPSFRQSPARGPRFTLATYEEGDPAARLRAGRRLLGCWGHARVEPRSP
jgi:hypothetical protein